MQSYFYIVVIIDILKRAKKKLFHRAYAMEWDFQQSGLVSIAAVAISDFLNNFTYYYIQCPQHRKLKLFDKIIQFMSAFFYQFAYAHYKSVEIVSLT